MIKTINAIWLVPWLILSSAQHGTRNLRLLLGSRRTLTACFIVAAALFAVGYLAFMRWAAR